MRAPIIPGSLPDFGTQVRLQALFEQTAAVEGMFLQYAGAPGVDGGNGRLVHGLRRQIQGPGAGRPALARPILAQSGQERIDFGAGGVIVEIVLGEPARSLGQAPPDAIPQLLSRCFGKGEHQDLGRQIRSLSTMPQHQAHVQGRNGPGLAGTGTGLDQVAAPQRKTQRIDLRNRSHAPPPASGYERIACAAAAYRTSAQRKKSPPAHSCAKSG